MGSELAQAKPHRSRKLGGYSLLQLALGLSNLAGALRSFLGTLGGQLSSAT